MYKNVLLILLLCGIVTILSAQTNGVVKAKHTEDFTVSGDGSSQNWSNAEWNTISQRDKKTLEQNHWNVSKLPGNDIQYQTAFKILWSDKGIYCLFSCEDSVLTVTHKEDFAALFNEDVVEVFLKPDVDNNSYFEYEVSPWNYELPLLIQNNGKDFTGWLPYMYKGDHKIKHAVHIGAKDEKTSRFIWTAEIFIPYWLIAPIKNVPPQKGTQWRANFYRIDYDRNPVYSSWQLTRNSYHDPEMFGTIVFE